MSKDQGRSLKEWLNDHKIYFETLAATLLSIMALIISGAQIYLTSYQSNLLDIQTRVAKESSLPQFTVSALQIQDYFTGHYSNDEIHVINHGEIALDLNASIAVFFEVESENGQTIEIPVVDYYNSSVYSNNAVGRLITISRDQNYKKIVELREQLGNTIVADLRVQRYVKLTYQDIFGDTNSKYFKTDFIHGSEILSQEEGENIYSKYYDSIETQDEYTLDYVTPDYILSLF